MRLKLQPAAAAHAGAVAGRKPAERGIKHKAVDLIQQTVVEPGNAPAEVLAAAAEGAADFPSTRGLRDNVGIADEIGEIAEALDECGVLDSHAIRGMQGESGAQLLQRAGPPGKRIVEVAVAVVAQRRRGCPIALRVQAEFRQRLAGTGAEVAVGIAERRGRCPLQIVLPLMFQPHRNGR